MVIIVNAGVFHAEQFKNVLHKKDGFFLLLSSSSWLVCIWQLCSCFPSSTLGLKDPAKRQTSNEKPDKLRYVFCRPIEVSSCCVSGPYTNIPITGPADTTPVARERRR